MTDIKEGRKKVIAFDMSLTNSGYAVGEVVDGELFILEVGSIPTTRFTQYSHGFRLNHIGEEVSKIYKRFPDADAVVKEGSFSNRFVRSTQVLFKVVGVWELITFLRGFEEFTDIAPSSVKKTVTGNGRANKQLVAEAVDKLTGIETANDDESDAIAVLLSYCSQEQLINLADFKITVEKGVGKDA